METITNNNINEYKSVIETVLISYFKDYNKLFDADEIYFRLKSLADFNYDNINTKTYTHGRQYMFGIYHALKRDLLLDNITFDDKFNYIINIFPIISNIAKLILQDKLTL